MKNFLIEKINCAFHSITKTNLIDPLKIGIAVSGGADSMALCIAMHEWVKNKNIQLTAITVDHKLRKESSDEAIKVEYWLKKNYGIHHVILEWKHDGIENRIQEQARNARYTMMTNYAKQNGIDVLCTAHHLNDQLETFLMRLSKGSGPDGLLGIRYMTQMNNVKILRPFLNVESKSLRKYLEEIEQPYIEDPSNDDLAFERVKWRHITKQLIKEGFSLENFSKSMNRMSDLNQWVEESLEDQMIDMVEEEADKKSISIPDLLQLNIALSTRLIIKILQEVSHKKYPYSYDKIKEIISDLVNPNFKACSAGGCVIIKIKDKLFIEKDPRIAD